MRSIRKVIGNAVFSIRYRLGLAQEGKDFFTCQDYDFYGSCTKDHKPCKNVTDGLKHIK